MISSRSKYKRFLQYRRSKVPYEKGDVSRQATWQQYRSWLWPYQTGFIVVFSLAIIARAFAMVLLLGTRYIIDDVLIKKTAEYSLHASALFLLALLVISQAISSYRTWLMSILNARVIFKLRQNLYKKLLHLPLSQLANLKTGGIVSRLSTDVSNVTGLVQMAVISPGVALVSILLTTGILLTLHWRLALAALAVLPLLFFASYLWVKRIRPIYRSMSKDRSEVDARVSETFGGIRVVRTFNREKVEEMGYANSHHTIIRKSIFANLYELLVDSGWNFLIPFTSLAIAWVGGSLYLADSASIGDIVAFQMYSAMLLNPVWRMVYSISQIQRSLASMDRVFDILNREIDKPDNTDIHPLPAKIETVSFHRVSFGYEKSKPVIHNFTVSVEAGSTVALVGASGAGKTTTVDLLARFYDVTRGSININCIDIRKFSLAGYRSLFSIVQQDVFLFDGSVSENIAYSKPGATMKQIEKAARSANAHEFIAQLSLGYDTMIGERGVKLSGGQKQRISIARAMLKDPQVLILDEATSNLDSHSEKLIQKSLPRLFKNRTVFVIAHRLSTIARADVIIVLKRGRIIETGNHQELMKRKSAYYSMVMQQQGIL